MKKSLEHITNIRYIIFLSLIFIFFLFMSYKLFNIQVLNKNKYLKNLDSLTIKTIKSTSVPRGRIYDRNYKLLVDNVGVKTIYYRKLNGTTTLDQIKIAYTLARNIDINYTKLTDESLRNFYYLNNKKKVDNYITKNEKKLYTERKLTLNELMNKKISRIKSEELNKYKEVDKKAAYIYYLMNKGYFYDEKIIKTYASDEEYAFVGENISKLKGVNIKLEWERKYIYDDVFRTILGNVSDSNSGIPSELKDYYLSKGYSLNDRVGVTYLEYQYEKELKGKKEVYKLNNDNSYTLLKKGVRGNDIVLTIDIDIQKEIENILNEEIVNAKQDLNTSLYSGSKVIVSDPKTGEILAMASKQITSDINGYKIYDDTPSILTNPVTPGSIVKGASMTVGYKSKVIDIGTRMRDECVKISGAGAKCSWKNLGVVDDVSAIGLSSNAYQFKIAIKTLGRDYRYNIALNNNEDVFKLYRNTFLEYGLGSKTNIDLPVESYGNKGTNDNPGTLLDLSIGQYDTYTPIQISNYINTVAELGNRYQLHLVKEIRKGTNKNKIGKLKKVFSPKLLNKVNVEDKYLYRIKEGFKSVMNSLGYGYMDENIDASGKTGTAESFYDTDNDGNVDAKTLSKAFIGYAPSDDPKYSVVILSPNVRYSATSEYVSPVNMKISSRVSNKVFEILK